MQNSFADLIPQQPAPQAGPVVVGTPRPRQPPQRAPQTPVEVDTDAANLERIRLANEAARVQRDAGAAAQAAEAERKAGAFFTRALGSNRDYEATGIGPRSWAGQRARDNAPDLTNPLNSDPRQVADSAQDEFIAATLRQDSGAAIPPDELERQRRIYFPMPGDRAPAIEQKRRARLRALQGLINSGGRSIRPEDRAAYSEWVASLGGTAGGQGAAPNSNDGGATPEEEQYAAAFEAALNSGQIRTPEELEAYATAHNRRIGPEHLAAFARFQQSRQRNPRSQIGVDRYVAPPPDISNVRGAEANPNALMLNEAVRNATPTIGPLFRAATGMLGQEGGDAFYRGFNDVPTFGFSDEIGAGIQAGLGQGNFDDNLARERSINEYDYENNFGARLGGQLAGGLTMPFNPAASLGRQAATVGTQGALYGFGSGEGANRVPNAVVGGTIGAAIPPAIRVGGIGVSALRGRPAQVTPEAQAIARAADAEGVTASRPIVDASARPRMGNLEASVGGGRPVRESLGGTARGIDERAGQLAAGGNAAERGVMGQRIQNAADRSHQQSGSAAGRVYDRADEAAEAAGGPRIYASETVSHLDQEISRLQRNPENNAAVIDYLQTVRGDFADEAGNLIPKTIADIRDVRTSLSGEINRRNLSMSSAERIVNQAITAANADVARDFGAAAPQALRLYNQADRMWRARAENRAQIIERLIGPDNNRASGGDVMTRVAAMGKGDTPRLRRLWAMLTPEERLDTAATVAATAGRRAPDEAFTPSQFIAWARAIPPSARQIMFGPEGARSIENLNVLSRALIDTRAALNNSRSGAVRNWATFIRSMAGGGVPGAAVGLVAGTGAAVTGAAGMALGAGAAGATALFNRLSARALMSPDMTRWLAAAPRMTTVQAIRSHIGRLTTIASRNPSLAQEATGLRRALLQAMNDNAAPAVGSAAASPNEGPDRQQ